MLVVTNLCWRISFRFHCSHTAFYGGIMPLNLADINTDYIIQKICGNEGDRHYLETLGFIEGATVRIVSTFSALTSSAYRKAKSVSVRILQK